MGELLTTKDLTLKILNKYVPEDFLNERLDYFDILEESVNNFPSSNWDAHIESISSLAWNPRIFFIDNIHYVSYSYFKKYNRILKNKYYKEKSFYDLSKEFSENDIFPTRKYSRSRYDTIQECLTILKYIDTDKPFTILDIGGGYGRLAEYFLKSPNCIYYNADTFALSSITAEWYLSHVVDQTKIKFLKDKDYYNKQLNFITTSQIESYIDNDINFDFIINVHSLDEMNIETIVKILELIDKNKNNYAYIKNHFITYNLGTNNAQIGTWDGIIPKNWTILENNYCS